MDGYVNNRKFIFTIDTGASHSIIKSSLIKQQLESANGMKLRTATGQEAAIRGQSTLKVTIGDSTVDHKFIVADIVDDVIIGVDFMTAQSIAIDMERMVLKFRNADIPLRLGYENNWTAGDVSVARNQYVPANSEAVVWATINGDCGANRLVIVEPENKSSKVVVGRSLVDVTQLREVPVRVLNPTSHKCLLKKGAKIAKCHAADVIINLDDNGEMKNALDNTSDDYVSDTWMQLSSSLTKTEQSKARKLLRKYSSLFTKEGQDAGRTNMVTHQIDTGDAKPIRQPPRSVPLAKRGEVERLIQEMQADKVIEPSSSPWSSPVVLVKKKDGSSRFCVDYRKLNEVTKKDSYPLPRIDDSLDTLSGSCWFSTLDLKSGYWQVGIDEKDREKTAFSVGTGLWQFTVMPFGLCNAPATFERLMERVLKGLHWNTCLVYLDDIIVMGRTFEEHLQNLEQVFQRIAAAGLKLNPKKCSFLQTEVKYLGHKVSREGVHTDEEKIDTVRTWPRPKNLHELRSFLGLCTYYRRFVPKFATVAQSLHELTRKNQKFRWNREQEIAFKKLKALLCSAPILSYPVENEPFILDTDASNTGIGGVLSQVVDGREKIVAFYSRTLGNAERNYCVTRRELLAVVESVKHFHKYLYGKPFRIRTDHAALRWLLQFKNPEGQLARWIERLQSYDFVIDHRKGGLHGNADALSRRPCNIECKHCIKAENKNGVVDVRWLGISSDERWSPTQIQRDQELDPDLKSIIEAKKNERRPSKQEIASKSPVEKAYWTQWNSLKLNSGCLYRTWESEDGKESKDLIVVPRSRISEVLQELHNGPSGGHLGVNKTVEKVKQRFYWIGCHQSAKDWIQNCSQCMAAKGPRIRSRGKMQQYNSGAPFERIAMDVAGPFPVTDTGNRYVLVVMDYFSKWPEVYAIPNQEAKTVAEVFLKNWVSRFGVPLELHSDQGRNFESEVFKELCEVLGIKKTRTTPLHPQSDGMVERFNRTLEEHLRKVVSDNQKDWDKHIDLFLMAYRSSVHDTTSQTPASILFGTELRLPADMKFGISSKESRRTQSYAQDIRRRIEAIHQNTRMQSQLKSDKMKARYDYAANCEGFEEGELVMLYNPKRRKGLSPKLQTCWEGPYKVVKRINDVVYRIQWNQSTRAKMKVVHLERLAKYGTAVSSSDRVDQT